MPLVATVGAADANSYVGLTEANAYLAAGAHLQAAAWTALDDTQKAAALITATRQIDRLRFWGCKYSELQALQFPREYCNWKFNEIPKELREAVMEQAVSLAPNIATGGQSTRERLQSQGVESYSIGDLSETFATSRTDQAVTSSAESKLCQDARILLAGFIRRTGQVKPGRRLS